MPHCIVTPISKVFFYGIPSRPRWFPQIFDNWFSHFVPIPKMRECDFEFPFPFPGSKKPFPLTSVLTLTMTMMVMKTMKVMTIMTMLEEQFTRTTFPCFVPFVVDAAWPCATSSGKQHSTLPTAQTFAILITGAIFRGGISFEAKVGINKLAKLRRWPSRANNPKLPLTDGPMDWPG